MKTLLSFPLLLLSLVSFPSWSETEDDLVQREGIYYKKFSDVPFTGEVEGIFQGKFRDGKREGSWLRFYDSGQMLFKGKYKNGEADGSWVFYYDNGRVSEKGEYRNGKRDGSWVGYHDNGQLWRKGAYKNGKEEGRWVYYDDDGTFRKNSSGVYKDGVKISD